MKRIRNKKSEGETPSLLSRSYNKSLEKFVAVQKTQERIYRFV
jgi:hypothetical protein